MRRKAGEGGDAAPIKCAELGEFSEKGGENGRADAWDGVKQPGLRGEGFVRFDELSDGAVELGDLAGVEVDHRLDLGGDFVLARVVATGLLGLADIDQLPATP
nr:hypothetical protein [Acuticoccus sediminis]